MSTTFDQFFSLLEFELQQVAETGDATAAESYKFLPKAYAKIYTNESIRELIDANPMKFWEEKTYIFDANTKILDIPSNWGYLIAYYDTLSDADYPHWTVADDVSNSDAYIRIVSPRRLFNQDGWTKGESFNVRVVTYPDPIVDDTDVVNWPDNHMRLLRLHVTQKAFGNKGKAMSAEQISEYQMKYQNFLSQGTPIKAQRYFAFRGRNMGRRI